MAAFNKKNLARRIFWICASLLLVGCEIGSSTKAQMPYRGPSSAGTSVSAGSGQAEVNTNLTVLVTVNDKYGYGVTNVVPTINAVNTATGVSTGVSSGGCSASNSGGVSTCSIRATIAGSYTLKVLTPVQATMTGTVTFYQVPRSISFTTSPSASTASKTVFAAQPVVTVLDAAGNAVPGGKTAGSAGTGQITLSLNGTTGGALLPAGASLTATANALSGIATFAGLNVDLSGTYTLTATLTDPVAGTVTGTSAGFTITSGVATAFSFTTQPVTTATGIAFSPQPVVKQVDASGNAVTTDSSCVITVALTSPNAGDQLMGTVLSMTMASGVADFSGKNLRVSRSGAGTAADSYQLTATGAGSCAGLTAATSSVFNITLVGLPSQLTVTQAPGTAALNETWAQQPIVKVLDNTGTVVAADNSTTVVMAITAFTGGSQGTLVGTTTMQVVAGVANFSGLSIPATIAQSAYAGTYTYTFTAFNGSLTIASTSTQQVITTNGLIPSALRFKVQPPGNVAVNQPMGTFEVQTVDSNGYPCKFDQTSTITLGIQGTVGMGMAPAQTMVTVVNGSAVFTGEYFTTQGAVQIIANGSNAGAGTTFSSIYSNVFTVSTHGSTADHLTFALQPSSSAGNDQAWTNQPVVYVVDAQGNVMTDDNTTIVTINCVLPITCPGKLLGNPTMRVSSGVANFSAAGLHLGGGANGDSPVLGEQVSATSSPAMPVAPTYSDQFSEPN